jgi:hypothetical protein
MVNSEYFRIWKDSVVVSFSYCNGIHMQGLMKAAETSIKLVGNPAHIRTGYLSNRNVLVPPLHDSVRRNDAKEEKRPSFILIYHRI